MSRLRISRPMSTFTAVTFSGLLAWTAFAAGGLLGEASTTTQPSAISQASTYISPEAAFTRCLEATKTGDFGTFFECFSEEGQNDMVGQMAVAIQYAARASTRPSTQPGDEHGVFERYHLGQLSESKFVAGAEGGLTFVGDVQRLGAQIPNRRAFAMEMIAQARERAASRGKLEGFLKARLTQVKIDGDQATGMFNPDGPDLHPVKFVKVQGSWLIRKLD